MTPVQVAAEILRVPPATLTATRIKGGLTNESWCVQGKHEGVVVRISTVDEHALQLNRTNEAQALSVAQQAEIGAEVLLCAPERRLLVTRLLNAKTLTQTALHESAILERVAQLLRRLHQLPVSSTLQQSDLVATLQGYWQSLDGHALGAAEIDKHAYALDIARESASIATRCLCHNDVHHLNLMSNGQRLWLLDWEYAGIGDAFFDLAAVCCYHGYDQPLREQLLLAYSAQIERGAAERLNRMCWLFDHIKELWLAVRALEA